MSQDRGSKNIKKKKAEKVPGTGKKQSSYKSEGKNGEQAIVVKTDPKVTGGKS